MKLKIVRGLKLLSLSLLIGLTTSAVFAWTSPTAAPTGGNTPAPLNVSSASQTKAGSLRLGGVRTSLSSYINFASTADLTATPYGTTNFNALALAVNGKVGATEYCDQYGENCTNTLGGGGGTGTSCPTYDSGFVDLGATGTVNRVFTHNLGTLNTEVYVESKAGTGGSNNILDIAANAINYFPRTYMLWTDKTANTVTVGRYASIDGEARYVRVVVKTTGCGGGGGGSGIQAPDYDSGWVDFGTTGNMKKKFTHNFGTDNYFVNLEGKATGGDDYNCPSYVGNESINNWLISSGYNFFYDKGPDSISLSLWPNSVGKCARYMRVKLWKHPAGTIAPSSTVTKSPPIILNAPSPLK